MTNRTGGGTRKPKKMSAGKKAALTVGLVLCVLLVLFSAVYGVFNHYFNKMNIVDPNEDTGVYLDENDLEIKEGSEETENSALEDIESLEKALKENEEEDYGLEYDDSNELYAVAYSHTILFNSYISSRRHKKGGDRTEVNVNGESKP